MNAEPSTVSGRSVFSLEAGRRDEGTGRPHEAPVNVRRPGGPRLHHVCLFVADIEEAVKFYTEGLSLTVRRRFADIVGRRGGDSFRFGLPSVFLEASAGRLIELHPAGAGLLSPPTFPLNHFALGMEDVDAAYDRALRAGARPVDIPTEQGSWDGSPLDVVMAGDFPESIRMAVLLGPNRELIELYQAAGS